MKKSKLFYWAAIVGLALALGWSLDFGDRTKKELASAQAKYNEASALNTELQGQLDSQIAASIAAVKAREERIGVLESEAIVLTKRVGQLTNALSQANEPPTTAEQEALPIVQYLRARDRMQEERFSLAMADNLKDHQVIDELRGIVSAKDIALAAWETKFNNEHALRLMSEDLGFKKDARIKSLERKSTVKTVVVATVVGTVTYFVSK